MQPTLRAHRRVREVLPPPGPGLWGAFRGVGLLDTFSTARARACARGKERRS